MTRQTLTVTVRLRLSLALRIVMMALRALGRVGAKHASHIDGRDLVGLSGLTMLFLGLRALSPAAALIIVGALLFLLSCVPSLVKLFRTPG